MHHQSPTRGRPLRRKLVPNRIVAKMIDLADRRCDDQADQSLLIHDFNRGATGPEFLGGRLGRAGRVFVTDDHQKVGRLVDFALALGAKRGRQTLGLVGTEACQSIGQDDTFSRERTNEFRPHEQSLQLGFARLVGGRR